LLIGASQTKLQPFQEEYRIDDDANEPSPVENDGNF
jgi:hypothetical protein